MIKFLPVEESHTLDILKQEHLSQTVAPLDGMWLHGFVPQTKHYRINDNDQTIGYYCINQDQQLLEFHVTASHQKHASSIFSKLISNEDKSLPKINGAHTSTAQPLYLSLCLDHFKSHQVHTYMYQLPTQDKCDKEYECDQNQCKLDLLTQADLGQAIEFAVDAVGMPKAFLEPYYQRLIDRGELYVYQDNQTWLALAGLRTNDQFQTSIADLGVIVAKPHRGKHIASKILKTLAYLANTKNLTPICSTTTDNIASQKAIQNAGFQASHRIVLFTA